MPNYIINECITNDVYILSAATLTSGATVEFGISETPFCGTVGAVTLSAETLNIYFLQLYDDCCACLEGDGRESLNFKFIRCGTLEEIDIEGTNFCTSYGLPLTGRTYEIQYGSETPFCATFTELSPTGQTNYFYVGGPFNDCKTCQTETPTISAGTYDYTVCVICDDGSTETAVTVEVPHPSYTNGYGQTVIQTQMVTLGGFNGLNS